MNSPQNQNMIRIEGAATYGKILTAISDVELSEGIRHINDFLKIYPDFAPAHNDLAVMYYQNGNSLKALAHYEKAHKLDSQDINFRKNLADFYFVELEWASEAIGIYQQILNDNPSDLEALNALGTISLQIGRREQARQYFNKTLQLDASNADALATLAQLPPASNVKTVAQALPLQSAAKQISAPSFTPSQPVPKRETPVVPENKLATPDFKNIFPTATVKADNPVDLYNETQSLIKADKMPEAISLLEKLVDEQPENAVACNDLGVLYQRSGNRDKARQYHEKAVDMQPTSKIFKKNLADLLYMEFYELEKALEMYVTLQAKFPQDIEILKAIASICQQIGNLSDARFFLERVLTLQPWDREAQQQLAKLESTTN